MPLKKTKTLFKKGFISPDEATSLYHFLKNNIPWVESIRSKKGFTRLGSGIPLNSVYYDSFASHVCSFLSTLEDKYQIEYIYLNYYQDGSDWCPNHTHPGTIQMILSLGATRKMKIGKQEFEISNGDIVLFGSSSHGIPKDPFIKEGRISIAIFMSRI